ncbi:MAG: hypothetical protein E3J54_01745 [Actinobacteria bacterium]|nr:MAG: hypothetical protein E3J54_01745 [Actinomycetota bacterium]
MKKDNKAAQVKLKKQIKSLKQKSSQKATKDETAPDSSTTNDSGKWPFYKNERFTYIVQIPPNWSKTHSQNGDGITLAKGGQKILVYGTNDYDEHETLSNHLDIEYGNKAVEGNQIVSKTEFETENATGFYVKTKSEEFYIYKSSDYFVYIYVESSAKALTKEIQKKIAESFQVQGE